MPRNTANVESVLELESLCSECVCGDRGSFKSTPFDRGMWHIKLQRICYFSSLSLQPRFHVSVRFGHNLSLRMPIFSRYFQPVQLFVGAMVVTLLFLGFVWAAENQAPIRRFRRNHPSITVFGILFTGYLFMSVLGGVAVFLFGVAFPILSKTTHTHTYQNPL